MAKNFTEKNVVAGTVSPEATAILDIARDVISAARRKKVFIIHMPRGATPIVDGINYVAGRLAKTRPYTVIKVPFSRENFPRPERAREIISGYLAEIPKNAIVYYVDESRTGTVTSANLEDIEMALRGKNCTLRAHLVVAESGKDIRKQSVELFQKAKARVVLHKVPGRISWADNTAVLGTNWGLMHRFPEEVLRRALGKGKTATSSILRLKREFLRIYSEKIRLGKDEKFREIRHSSAFYAQRQEMAIDSFREAAEITGFDKAYNVSISGKRVKVNGKTIPFWDLQRFLLDNHPGIEREKGSKQKRFAYRNLVLSDPNILVTLSQITPHSAGNTKRVRREIGQLLQKRKHRR